MSTSRTAMLSKPTGDNQIATTALTYLRGRNRQQAFNLVISLLKESGISQATLGRRLGKGADVISRLLRRPQNWEHDTFSDLVFAISGGLPSYGVLYPSQVTTVVTVDLQKNNQPIKLTPMLAKAA